MTAVRPSKAAYNLVVARDRGACALCGDLVWGERGFDFSLHHRRAAAMGGDRTVATHSPANLILLHGHGTSLCHGDVEANRTKYEGLGFLVRRPNLPAGQPIRHAVHGWCLLADDGSFVSTPPAAEEAA